MSRLREKYNKEVKKAMMDKFSYKNIHQVPKLEKIVLNTCSRDCVTNGKVVESLADDLRNISGQQPVVTRAKNSIASFKIREGQALGASVTLRGDRMYEFLDRLISISLPRTRDFRGVSPKAFDGRGNYALGIKEQIIDLQKRNISVPLVIKACVVCEIPHTLCNIRTIYNVF